MTRFTLVVPLAFVFGCSGESFSTASLAALDAGAADVMMTATGGAHGTGGASSTGGKSTGGEVSTGGAPDVDAGSGGTPSTGGSLLGTGGSSRGTGGLFQTGGGSSSTGGAGIGGALVTGGTSSTGGAIVDACVLVTHDNGLGQTWQDCTPIGTYNLEQAMKACEASGATTCRTAIDCNGSILGMSSVLHGLWVYGDPTKGWVYRCSVMDCGCPTPGGTNASTWN